MIIVYSENHAKHVNALYGKMNSFLMLKQAIHLRIVTIFMGLTLECAQILKIHANM